MAGIAMATVEPFVDCSEDLGNPERLRARGADNGYLFFPGLLPAAEVLAVRRAVLEVAEEHQLLRPGSDPDLAIRRDGVYVDVEYERNPTPAVRNFRLPDMVRCRTPGVSELCGFRASSGVNIRRSGFIATFSVDK